MKLLPLAGAAEHSETGVVLVGCRLTAPPSEAELESK